MRGEEYPYETLEMTHDNDNKDLRGYFQFLQATGSLGRHKGNMVRRADWGHRKNCTLFVFDNAANGCLNSPILNPKQNGELHLVFNFGANPGVNTLPSSCTESLRISWRLTETKPCCMTFTSVENTEKVSFNNMQVYHLA